jgi:hypothetical protein
MGGMNTNTPLEENNKETTFQKIEKTLQKIEEKKKTEGELRLNLFMDLPETKIKMDEVF